MKKNKNCHTGVVHKNTKSDSSANWFLFASLSLSTDRCSVPLSLKPFRQTDKLTEDFLGRNKYLTVHNKYKWSLFAWKGSPLMTCGSLVDDEKKIDSATLHANTQTYTHWLFVFCLLSLSPTLPSYSFVSHSLMKQLRVHYCVPSTHDTSYLPLLLWWLEWRIETSYWRLNKTLVHDSLATVLCSNPVTSVSPTLCLSVNAFKKRER